MNISEKLHSYLIEEGISDDAKKFMKEFNQAVTMLKSDVKESNSNGNWIGALEYIQNLIAKQLKK